MKRPYEYGNEVARAVAANAPVVALETTVVTHGLPHPDGVTTALALEQIIREAGATPASIGIIGDSIRTSTSTRTSWFRRNSRRPRWSARCGVRAAAG